MRNYYQASNSLFKRELEVVWISVGVEGAPINFLVEVALYSQNEDQHS
jgi:hypothetical protein